MSASQGIPYTVVREARTVSTFSLSALTYSQATLTYSQATAHCSLGSPTKWQPIIASLVTELTGHRSPSCGSVWKYDAFPITNYYFT